MIVKADGASVNSVARLRDVVATKKPGDSIELGIVRDTKHKTLTVKLGRQPSISS